MKIIRTERLRYVQNLSYPIIGDKVQNDLDDTDSIIFSRFVARKAIKMCADRLERILANNPDDFDLEEEISKVHETLRFAEKNIIIQSRLGDWNGRMTWVCVNYIGMEFVFDSEPHRIDFG